jgi:hypothetical protein
MMYFKHKRTFFDEKKHLSLQTRTAIMGLPLRITFKENDYVYQIINSKLINQYTTEFDILLNGDKVSLVKDDKMLWVQKDEIKSVDPELINALGRSVSLRLRL